MNVSGEHKRVWIKAGLCVDETALTLAQGRETHAFQCQNNSDMFDMYKNVNVFQCFKN